MFPAMPPIVDGNGDFRDPVAARDVLMETCYQCHPGRRTDCLRGAMASGGMLCQDCHGDMQQVGDDFTRTVSSAIPGVFDLPATSTPIRLNRAYPGPTSQVVAPAIPVMRLDNMHGEPHTIGDPVMVSA